MLLHVFGKDRPDLIATVTYLTTDEGGRKTPANSGYRPQFGISDLRMQTSGEQIFINKDSVNPGETAKAEITLLSPQFFEGKLFIGKEFEFKEGSRLIARGKIEEILNKALEGHH